MLNGSLCFTVYKARSSFSNRVSFVLLSYLLSKLAKLSPACMSLASVIDIMDDAVELSYQEFLRN